MFVQIRHARCVRQVFVVRSQSERLLQSDCEPDVSNGRRALGAYHRAGFTSVLCLFPRFQLIIVSPRSDHSQELLESSPLRCFSDLKSVCSDEALQEELFDPVGRLLFRKICTVIGGMTKQEMGELAAVQKKKEEKKMEEKKKQEETLAWSLEGILNVLAKSA